MTRQQRRRTRFLEEFRSVNEEFGYIVENHRFEKRPHVQYHIPRQVRRRIARAKAKVIRVSNEPLSDVVRRQSEDGFD